MAAAAVCPICGGTGWKIIERAGLSGAEPCRCAGEARAEALQDNSGIPPKYAQATLQNFVVPNDNPVTRPTVAKALITTTRFVQDFPTGDHLGLLIAGDTGTGKTHLAVGAAKVLMEKGHQCVFFDYQNLLDRIRSSYDKASGSGDREAYGSAMESDVLVLDDLGSHRVTEWVEDIVTSIITYRYNNRKALIVTTNLDPKGAAGYTTEGGAQVSKKSLREVIGARASSRLSEMCRAVDLFGVEDYREKRARSTR
jgi:DNA replication protein DnaC